MKNLFYILCAGIIGGCTIQYTQHNPPPTDCEKILIGGDGYCIDDDCLCPDSCDYSNDYDCFWVEQWAAEDS